MADLGYLALSGVELQTLHDRTVVQLATILNVEMCKVLVLSADGGSMKLVAGCGWHEGVVGETTVSTGAESLAGYTLLSREPVVVDDLRTETRFIGMPLLHDHGVVSGVSIIIGKLESPLGALGVHTIHHTEFSSDDVNFLQAIANILGRGHGAAEIRIGAPGK